MDTGILLVGVILAGTVILLVSSRVRVYLVFCPRKPGSFRGWVSSLLLKRFSGFLVYCHVPGRTAGEYCGQHLKEAQGAALLSGRFFLSDHCHNLSVFITQTRSGKKKVSQSLKKKNPKGLSRCFF